MQLAQKVSKQFGFLKSSEIRTEAKDGHAEPPEWEEDHQSEDCCCCLIKFTVTRRKHHCRKCGRVVCGTCSLYRSPIPEMGFPQPVRICVDCNCAAVSNARGINLQMVAEYIMTEIRPKAVRTVQERLNAVQLDQAKQELISLKAAIREHELKLEKAHQENSTVDMMEYSRQMNVLVQQIGTTTEVLRAARSNLGQVVIGVVATEHAEFSDARHRRYLVVTPGPEVIVAISGLNNNSGNRNASFKGGIRFMAVHTMDEVLKVRRCKIQVLGAKAQMPRMLPALHILWDTPVLVMEDESTSMGRPSVGGIAGGSSNSLTVQTIKSTQSSSSTEFYITADVSEQSRTESFARTAKGEIKMTEEDLGKGLYDALQAARRKHFDRVTVQKKRLDQLSELKDQTVSWGDPLQASMLRELWKAVRPNALFPGEKSEKWKDLGFQGMDPVTDFRGMGSLSLHCMLYWARSYPQYSVDLISQQSSRPYPICTAVINLCSLVADLSGLNSRNASQSPLFRVFCRTPEEEAPSSFFEQVVSVCLALMDHFFVKSRSGYMDFPKIVAVVRDIISAAAALNPVNFAELMGIIHEAFLPSSTLFGEMQDSIVVKPSWPTSYARQSIGMSSSLDLTKSVYLSVNSSDDDSRNPDPSRSPSNLTPTSTSFLAAADYPDGSTAALTEASFKSKSEGLTREQRVSVYFDPVTPSSASTKLRRSRGHLDISAVEEFDDGSN